MTNFTFAERDKRYRKVAASAGNAQARGIVRRLERLREDMAAFLRDHPRDCKCAFCQDDDGSYGRLEVQGFLWAADNFVAAVGGMTVEPQRPRGKAGA